ncbi:MAG: hypothetical protein WD691_06750 [Acidimicrobiales bacterium]
MIELLGSSAFMAALLFGLRHGVDWDHIAALADLTGSQTSTRRSMRLATLYALGHASMVLVLGAVAILFAERLPTGVDEAMHRVVGVSLILLGIWLVQTAVRTRGVPPLRSRWMVVINAVRSFLGRCRNRGELIVVEHAHPHDHGHSLHGHVHEVRFLDDEGANTGSSVTTAFMHTHLHRHVGVAPVDPFLQYGRWSSFGVGVLHGIGVETPTQLMVFAAAASADGRATSLGLLGCFVVGLLASNTAVAAASTLGFRTMLRNRVMAGALAGATALFSLALGITLLTGHGPSLPALLGG